MNKDRLIRILAVLCIFSVAGMVSALCLSGQEKVFTAPPFEPAAQSGTPSVTEDCGYQEMDVQLFRVGLCGEIRINGDAAEVWFANPQDNPVWLRLRILDEEGRILGQTGLIRPGEYIQQIALEEATPGTAMILKVMAYEPDTYHSAGAMTFHTVIAAE